MDRPTKTEWTGLLEKSPMGQKKENILAWIVVQLKKEWTRILRTWLCNDDLSENFVELNFESGAAKITKISSYFLGATARRRDPHVTLAEEKNETVLPSTHIIYKRLMKTGYNME
uniref:Uncharacterized protein n=1 Tax=Romanomermis culicivorax TaxID=13658 RepID=A0A915HP99_ROMCU